MPPPRLTLRALAVKGSITFLTSLTSCRRFLPPRPRWNTKEWGTVAKSCWAWCRAAARSFFWCLLWGGHGHWGGTGGETPPSPSVPPRRD